MTGMAARRYVWSMQFSRVGVLSALLARRPPTDGTGRRIRTFNRGFGDHSAQPALSCMRCGCKGERALLGALLVWYLSPGVLRNYGRRTTSGALPAYRTWRHSRMSRWSAHSRAGHGTPSARRHSTGLSPGASRRTFGTSRSGVSARNGYASTEYFAHDAKRPEPPCWRARASRVEGPLTPARLPGAARSRTATVWGPRGAVLRLKAPG